MRQRQQQPWGAHVAWRPWARLLPAELADADEAWQPLARPRAADVAYADAEVAAEVAYAEVASADVASCRCRNPSAEAAAAEGLCPVAKQEL